MTNRVGPYDLSSMPRPDTLPVLIEWVLLSSPFYRLYRMSAVTGTIQSFEDLRAESDDEAIEMALREAGELRIELWRGSKKIAAISGRDEPAEFMIAPPTG